MHAADRNRDLEKTTVYLETDVYRRIKLMAEKQKRSAAELVREAVGEYAMRHAGQLTPASLGAGRSGRGDLSETCDDLLPGFGADG